jgi:hypothetical protein
MEWLAASGGGAFVLVSLLVGTRLILLARRTGEFPEFAIGGALVLMGGIGYPATAIARGAEGLDPAVRGAIAGFAMTCQAVGITGLAAFTWRVFRADQAAAKLAVGVLGALAAGTVLADWLGSGFASAVHNTGLPMRGNEALAGTVLGWCTIESLAYFSKLQRRVALGLASPVVADRMRLWGIASGVAMLLNIISQVAAWNGVDIATSAFGSAVIGILGPIAAGAMWLAFFPPPWYLRRLEPSAEKQHG